MLYGIDISHHQGTFDLHRTAREGFHFAFLKATEGSSFVDSRFARNLRESRAAGLLPAAYHYQRGDSSAVAQADHIRRIVPAAVPVILDVEANGGHSDLSRDIIGRLTASGYRSPLLYLPQWYWKQIGSPDLRGLPPLWYSRYANNEGGYASEIYERHREWFAQHWGGYGGLPVAVLQFTSSATVAGHTPVDANAFRGTRGELAALLGSTGEPGGIESMALDTPFVDSFGNTQTVESFMVEVMRKLNDLHYPAVVPGSVPSRIPGDRNTTNVFDMIKDSTSWTNQILGLVARMQAGSTTDPNEIAAALRPVIADVVGPVVQESVTAALGEDNRAQADAIVTEIANRLANQKNPVPDETA